MLNSYLSINRSLLYSVSL